MSGATHYATAPEDRIPFHQKLIFGLGAFVNNILAAAIGGMIIVLNLGLGMNPALVGWLGAIPRLTDASAEALAGFRQPVHVPLSPIAWPQQASRTPTG